MLNANAYQCSGKLFFAPMPGTNALIICGLCMRFPVLLRLPKRLSLVPSAPSRPPGDSSDLPGDTPSGERHSESPGRRGKESVPDSIAKPVLPSRPAKTGWAVGSAKNSPGRREKKSRAYAAVLPICLGHPAVAVQSCSSSSGLKNLARDTLL